MTVLLALTVAVAAVLVIVVLVLLANQRDLWWEISTWRSAYDEQGKVLLDLQAQLRETQARLPSSSPRRMNQPVPRGPAELDARAYRMLLASLARRPLDGEGS